MEPDSDSSDSETPKILRKAPISEAELLVLLYKYKSFLGYQHTSLCITPPPPPRSPTFTETTPDPHEKPQSYTFHAIRKLSPFPHHIFLEEPLDPREEKHPICSTTLIGAVNKDNVEKTREIARGMDMSKYPGRQDGRLYPGDLIKTLVAARYVRLIGKKVEKTLEEVASEDEKPLERGAEGFIEEGGGIGFVEGEGREDFVQKQGSKQVDVAEDVDTDGDTITDDGDSSFDSDATLPADVEWNPPEENVRERRTNQFLDHWTGGPSLAFHFNNNHQP